MSAVHATSRELEGWVMGTLDAASAARVEEHCAACEGCAAALASEASLEIAFEQVAARVSRAPVQRSVRVVAYAAAGLVAMAAAALLWVGRAPVATAAAGQGETAVGHSAIQDGAILDARNDALDGG